MPTSSLGRVMTRLYALLLVLSTALLAACAGTEAPTGSEIRPTSASLSAQGGSHDDELARIAREELPGFAGVLLDSPDELTVLIAGEAGAHGAPADVASAMARIAPRGASRVRVRRVDWDFAQLKSHADKLMPMLDRTEVSWLDIDERRNRVVLAVNATPWVATIRAEARALGVPDAVLLIEVEARPEETSTGLQHRVRPVAGALSISAGGDCTLGIALQVDGADRFITASHCSSSKFWLDNSVMYQHAGPSPSNRLGKEWADPRPGFSGCHFDNYPDDCRYSDVSIYRLDAGVDFLKGRIYKTIWGAQDTSATLTIDTENPHFFVSQNWNQWTDAPVGTFVNKIGRRTGWTGGPVVQTCVHSGLLRCQWVADFYADSGDSGAPVFAQIPGAFPYVALHGFHWGRLKTNTKQRNWYSTMRGVERDFFQMELDVIFEVSPTPNPVTVTIFGPLEVRPNESCSFTASAVGGSGNFSISWLKDGIPIGTGFGVTTSSASSYNLEAIASDPGGGPGGSALQAITVSSTSAQCADQ